MLCIIFTQCYSLLMIENINTEKYNYTVQIFFKNKRQDIFF
jgi:hypothetical protein